MEIIREFIPRITIDQFAEESGLKMKVMERKVPEDDPMRYYAHFVSDEGFGVDVKHDGILSGTFGNGVSEQDAIDDYATKINLKVLVVDAYSDTRKEFNVPRLKVAKDKK